MTNYDLALMKFAFSAASELAGELEIPEEAAHWKKLNEQLPELDVDKDGALTFAKGFSYDQSHRHFSHAMAIHPLGLLDWSQGEKSQQIIKATIKKLQDYGPDYWTGYSYSWFGNMKARAFDGDGAARELRTFAECFCLRNTFHANGDQTSTHGTKVIKRDIRPVGRDRREHTDDSGMTLQKHFLDTGSEGKVTFQGKRTVCEFGLPCFCLVAFETRKGEWVDIKPADHRIE